jgi:hypothetical protein
MNTHILELMDTHILELMDTHILELMNTHILELMNTHILELMNTHRSTVEIGSLHTPLPNTFKISFSQFLTFNPRKNSLP